ncbi:iron chaperone [Cohnella yongneupensis]|uniref:Iron chaperone n=1 Tax=Cohnella yongneupensis TaxID=425006 RepID=A0ABW0R1C2_9BACL
MRRTVREAEPEATEGISYQIPAFDYHGKLIYYSAYTKHYSLSFPPPFTVFEVFKDQLSSYVVSKSVIQLPMNQPLPLALIAEMVKFRAKENKDKPAKKRK